MDVGGKREQHVAREIGGMYTSRRTGYTGSQSAHWNQFALQADYALSKRTDVHLEGDGLWGGVGTQWA